MPKHLPPPRDPPNSCMIYLHGDHNLRWARILIGDHSDNPVRTNKIPTTIGREGGKRNLETNPTTTNVAGLLQLNMTTTITTFSHSLTDSALGPGPLHAYPGQFEHPAGPKVTGAI